MKDPKNLPRKPFEEEFQQEEVNIQLLTERAEQQDFYNLPTSPATDGLIRVIGSSGNLREFASRRKNVSHGQKVEVLESGSKRQVTMTGSDSTVTLELADINKLLGNNKTIKKFFIYTMIKLNEQAYSGGTMRRNYISFRLQDLIDNHLYSAPQSARTAFDRAGDVLTSIKAKGERKDGKNRVTQSAIEVLFTGFERKSGDCIIHLNERINWGIFAAYYTILPKYYFDLSNRASDLMLYIFYLARQRVKDIAEDGGRFTIGMRAIQERLNLPSEVGNTDPQRTIREPIEAVIEELEDREDPDIAVTAIYNDNSSITDFLDHAYLEIILRGKYAAPFKELYDNEKKQIESAKRKKERIEEAAKIKNLAKAMEADKKKSETSDGA